MVLDAHIGRALPSIPFGPVCRGTRALYAGDTEPWN